MWKRLQIGSTVVEYDADATRRAYTQDEGGISSCVCDYCTNYRLVRDQVYPLEFRALLEQLGIDYCKEVELTHLQDDNSEDGAAYGHPVLGHYAFVGRVLEPQKNIAVHHDAATFDYGVTSGDHVHPTTRGRFGNSTDVIDLNFWVPYVPQASDKLGC